MGVDAAGALARIARAKAAVLIGERVVELLGGPEALDRSARTNEGTSSLVVFDCHALDLPQVAACIGLPNCAERTGTWIDVDGKRGPISAAKPAPANVRALTRLLDDLVKLSPKVGTQTGETTEAKTSGARIR